MDRDFHANFDMEGRRIRTATVDLSKPWNCIRDRLLELIVTKDHPVKAFPGLLVGIHAR